MVASPLWFASGAGGEDLGLRPAQGAAAPPPLLGQHSVEVLTEEAGLAGAQVEAMLERGAVVRPD